MNRIAEAVDLEKIYPSIIEVQRRPPRPRGPTRSPKATVDVAETLNLKVICAWTSSGSTGLRIARQRPRSSISWLTIVSVARRLAVVWGVHPIVTDDARDERDMADRVCRHAYIEGFAGEGERMIVVAGAPFGTPGDEQLAHRDRGVQRWKPIYVWTTPASPATVSRRRWTAACVMFSC